MANLPDFVNLQADRGKKLSAAEMLDQIKRKDELSRVNKKFGPGSQQQDNEESTPTQKSSDSSVLQKTTNLLDEAELALIQ